MLACPVYVAGVPSVLHSLQKLGAFPLTGWRYARVFNLLSEPVGRPACKMQFTEIQRRVCLNR